MNVTVGATMTNVSRGAAGAASGNLCPPGVAARVADVTFAGDGTAGRADVTGRWVGPPLPEGRGRGSREGSHPFQVPHSCRILPVIWERRGSRERQRTVARG